ncbi:MAG TPA: hypothetical protein VK590_07100 [Saprospiraceae bacterium]|nr:hypothetical protein [Saprospiraceae bacterium]
MAAIDRIMILLKAYLLGESIAALALKYIPIQNKLKKRVLRSDNCISSFSIGIYPAEKESIKQIKLIVHS